MQQSIQLDFHKKPSSLLNLIQGFRYRNQKIGNDKQLTRIETHGKNLSIDIQHLNRFNRICQLDENTELPILYPFTISYTYMMSILTRKEMPFSIFKALNTRNRISQYRTISIGEMFDISCRNSDIRYLKNGFEIDIHSEMKINDEIVWENTATYLTRMRHKEERSFFTPPRIKKVEGLEKTDSWYLKAKDRFLFARISGDSNGIHYGSLYAKSFGFKRDFAQPIRIAAKCADILNIETQTWPVTLEFHLKGPVYYENELVMNSYQNNNDTRFDLYCGTNERPCIVGLITTGRG